MLHELYQDLCHLPVPPADQEEQARLRAFERLLELVQRSELVDGKVLNLTKFLGEVHIHSAVPVVSDRWNVPVIVFAVLGLRHRPQRFPMIILPRNYVQQVQKDPLHALSGIVNIASRVRDFLCGLLESPETETRAKAFEAEFLWGVRRLHEQEGLGWSANAYQLAILSEFPGGLASLAPDLAYPTPTVFVFPVQEEG